MRFRAKCAEPAQMIALSRITSAIHKLTKSVVMILWADRISFVMPTSVATYSNASAISRCVSALMAQLDAAEMFVDYAIEFATPNDDRILMHLDTEHLARAFLLKSSTDRSLSFTIKLAKMGDKPCILVKREQLLSSVPDHDHDGMDASSGVSSFFLEHKLGFDWVPRRNWAAYSDTPAVFHESLPPTGIGMPNDLRHIKTVIDRFSNLSKDGKAIATLRVDPRRHVMSFRIDNMTFDAEAEFSDLPVFNVSDYDQSQHLPAGNKNGGHAEFEAQIDLRRLGEALTAMDKITQQSFVPATLALLGLKNRRAVVLLAVAECGMHLMAAISTLSRQDDEDDLDEYEPSDQASGNSNRARNNGKNKKKGNDDDDGDATTDDGEGDDDDDENVRPRHGRP